MRRSVRNVLIVVAAVIVVGAIAVAVVNLANGGAAPAPGASPSGTASSSPSASPAATPGSTPSPSASASVPPEVEPTPDPTDQVQPEPAPTGPATVTMVTWGADGQTVYASGVVTGDAGSAGVCTLTATASNGQSVSADLDAQATPAAANCGVIQIRVPAGTWSLVLSYRSGSSVASSVPTEVVQP